MMIDLHTDTISALKSDESLLSNPLMIDVERAEKLAPVAICFALFVEKRDGYSSWEEAKRLHKRFEREMAKGGGRIAQLRTAEAVEKNRGVGAVLTTEEGDILEGEVSRIATLADWGVKSFSFTWNFENDLAYPNSRDSGIMQKGLKEKGLEALSLLERHHIVPDVSHLNDGGFWDVVRHADKPFWATHSDCRALVDHPRNLSDRMLRALAEKGGVTGINLCTAFTGGDGMDDVVRHVMHIRDVAGSETLAIGSDFDGIRTNPALPDISSMPCLFDRLKKEGLSESELDGFIWKNALRVLKNAEC